MAGRSELLRARSLDLQILSLLGERLEDRTCFVVSKVAQRHLLQEVISDGDLQLELVAFAHDTTEGEGMEGELTLLHRDVEGLLYAVNDRDEGSLFTFDLDLRGSYTQPIKDGSLEDMVCDLVLRATHGDGLRGERYPIEVPRTCEVLDSDARLRLLRFVLSARSRAEDDSTEEKGCCPLLDIHTALLVIG